MSTNRFYNLRKLMESAFDDGELIESKKLAEEYLKMASSKKTDWNYGNAIHHGNLILGRISLKKGEIEEAKKYLIKAGRTPGSPQLNSFGPNMKLAKELLEVGESEIVIKYLELCKDFWNIQFSEINILKWKETIEKGNIPDFKSNLLY